jgi:hypothetical protein
MVYVNELFHHGIKGQKWGVRRYQNPDGTLTEAGKKKRKIDWYGDKWTGNDRFRPKDKNERSRNVTIDSSGGRRINAHYKTRLERGKNLTEAGITENVAVKKAVGRIALLGALTTASILVNNNVAANALLDEDYNLAAIEKTMNKLLMGSFAWASASIIIKEYQDLSDIDTYKESQKNK